MKKGLKVLMAALAAMLVVPASQVSAADTCEYHDWSDYESCEMTCHWHLELEPSDGVDGYGYYTCDYCGEQSPTVYLHDYEAVTTKEATCTEDGEVLFTCRNCGDSYTDIDEGGHNFVSTGTVISEGYKNDSGPDLLEVDEAVCIRCGETGTVNVYSWDGHTHTYGEDVLTTLEPTCVKDGVKVYECTDCGERKAELIPATGEHANTEVRNASAATCTAAGYTGDTYCTDCGTLLQSGTEIPAKGHSFADGTCTACGTQESTGETTEDSVTTEALAKGSVFTAGNVKYKVNADGTVSVSGAAKKTVKSVTIGATVKYNGVTYKVTGITANAFRNCKKLTKVTIGKNVTKIGKKAFYGCKNLKKVTVKSKKLKSVGSKAFTGINRKAVFKVPAKKLKAYKKLLKAKTGFKKTMKVKK